MKYITCFTIPIILLMIFSKSLQAEQKVVLATHTKPPLSNIIEAIYREAFDRMGYELSFITLPGRRVVSLVNNGVIDGDASRMQTFKDISSDKTDNYILVDEPVIDIELVVIVNKNVELAAVDWKWINEGKVSYISGSMHIQNNIEAKNRVPLPQIYAVLEMVKRGRTRSAILFKSMAIEMFNKEAAYYDHLKIIDMAIDTFYLYPFLNKKHIGLQSNLKKTLQEMKLDGTYSTIINRF